MSSRSSCRDRSRAESRRSSSQDTEGGEETLELREALVIPLDRLGEDMDELDEWTEGGTRSPRLEGEMVARADVDELATAFWCVLLGMGKAAEPSV